MIILTKRRMIWLKKRLEQQTSLLIALALIFETCYPTSAWALTGGPSQPEVQSFEPVGTTDMVDLFTGDFSYNIPLLEVEGYPVNISYHSGIGTDQEASWVGLGWNINPGVINRGMRGLPDDFNGETVKKQMNMKPNKTWGVALNIEKEIFGKGGGNIGGFGFSYGYNFNNYTGPSIVQSFNVNISAALGSVGALNTGLGITSSSDEGLTVQPSLSFSKNIQATQNKDVKLGLNIGTAFNSRSGLSQLSIGASATVVRAATTTKSVKNEDGSESVKEVRLTDKKAGSSNRISAGVGGSFNLGQPTYTPKLDMPMKNFSMSGKFTLGGELLGLHGKIGLSGFYSAQELINTSQENPAYGFLYAQNGQHKSNALLDFNREKDGTFTENTPSLPLTNFTYDTYGVSGQGIGGSYRPFRGDIGCVSDNESYMTNDNDALTVELGLGGYTHFGTNITVIDVSGKSGKWKSDNAALYNLVHTDKGNGNDFENVYFKEANEKAVDEDPDFYASIGEGNPVRFDVDLQKFNHKIKSAFDLGNNSTLPFSGPIKRKKRDKRTQDISFLKKSEYADFAIEQVPGLSTSAKDDHIAEITTQGVDGSRYIYGLPVYNTKNKEITFSVGSSDIITHDNDGALTNIADKGLVAYSSGDNSTSNSKGIDNYYSSMETPAYAHSYLLTSVLSADYIDADSIKGPSDADFGDYTKFRYNKAVSGYKWRTPVESFKASYNEGLKSDYQDDKGNIVYGEKDVFFLDSIITKNYIAVFHKSDRSDAREVNGEDGGVNFTNRNLKKLDSISLYSKRDLSQPIKRVHFEYSYDLCPNTPNSNGGVNSGKLTLKKIYFSYQDSYRARLSPYIFDYHEGNTGENPAYNLKAYDRWGNYKPNNANTIGTRDYFGSPTGNANSLISSVYMPPAEYPYTEQDPTLENTYASVWSLKEIDLPSGGTIKISYESDDYAYVQNRQAGEMYKVINYNSSADASNTLVDFSTPDNGKFYFTPRVGFTDIKEYFKGLRYIYFRFLVNIRTVSSIPNIEYVSGYGELDSCGYDSPSGKGWFTLKKVNLKDNGGGTDVNPIVKASVNFGRIHLPKKVWDATAGNVQGTLSPDIVKAIANASFTKNIKDAIKGPSQALFQTYNVGKYFVAGKSWVRLNNPDGHKLGGGHRVTKIEMVDNWQGMAGTGNGDDSNYGQVYNYNLEDGRSSGVASYEPQLGGDENPHRQPVFTSTKKLLVPNDESYVETPFGEMFYPSPSVGYSRVSVKNIPRAGVTRHATGATISEFYTAKDFPTLTSRTTVKFKRGKDGPGSIRSLLKINARDYFAATQGFVVETNDMHGKPMSTKVYQEGQAEPITSIEYKYKCDSLRVNIGGNSLFQGFHLNNKCTVINKDGSNSERNIGIMFDMVGDLRESTNDTRSITTEVNVDVIPILGVPTAVPGIWPGYAKEKIRFRSASLTKVIQRFGILEETVAKDLGSVVSTKNLAYDSETGGALLTETITDYNDKIYTLKYPAWWYYEQMGPSYQNLGVEKDNVVVSAGSANVGSMSSLFREGDEVALISNGLKIRAWVKTVVGSTIVLIDKTGFYMAGTFDLKVLRSGKRNNLSTDMASITTLSNPLSSLASNTYQDVLQASATEFTDQRRTHCDCLQKSDILPNTTNRYVAGTKGTFRPIRTYAHLTGRSQTIENRNTNIRRDGIFESYTPFYQLTNGSWQMNPKDWTNASEVTEFNVFGEEVENKDALNRYSSATYGYNQTQALSVAANAQFKEQGFDGFEDYRFNPCVDDHFKFGGTDTSGTESHTGRYSFMVTAGSPKTLVKQVNLGCAQTGACTVSLTSVYDPILLKYVVTATLGTSPYAFSWEINSGFPAINLTQTGLEISSSLPFSVEVSVTDNKGCSKNITIKN
jgi:hypothetical protein